MSRPRCATRVEVDYDESSSDDKNQLGDDGIFMGGKLDDDYSSPDDDENCLQ